MRLIVRQCLADVGWQRNPGGGIERIRELVPTINTNQHVGHCRIRKQRTQGEVIQRHAQALGQRDALPACVAQAAEVRWQVRAFGCQHALQKNTAHGDRNSTRARGLGDGAQHAAIEHDPATHQSLRPDQRPIIARVERRRLRRDRL